MAKHYGDIPCVKLAKNEIHITTSGTKCLCGVGYRYGAVSRIGKSVNLIWRTIDSVTCEKCKKIFSEQ